MPSYPVPAMPAVDDILSGLSSALATAGGARLPALQHLNALSTHAEPARDAVAKRCGAGVVGALGQDVDVAARCEAAAIVCNLMHENAGRASVLVRAGVLPPLLRLLRERDAATLARAALAVGALLRASATRRDLALLPEEQCAACKERLLPLLTWPHTSVSDAAEYALHGLCQNDPAQLSDLRDQASQMRSMSGDPPIARPAALPAAPPAPIADAFEYVIADVPVDAVSATDGDGGELRACKRVRVKGADGPTMTCSPDDLSADEFRALVSAWVLQTNVPGGDDPQAALPQPPN